MITRLEVDGFKSLREFSTELEPLTVFIGPNSAGKSNLLDALSLLSRLSCQSVDEAFKEGRGRAIDQFTLEGRSAAQAIRFGVDLLLPVRSGPHAKPALQRCKYGLVIERRTSSSGVETLSVQREELTAIPRSEDRWLDAHPASWVDVSTNGREVPNICITTPRPKTAIAHHQAYPGGFFLDTDAAYDTGAFFDGPGDDADPEREVLRAVGAELSSFRLLQLDTAPLRNPSERIGTGILTKNASNLPRVLAGLSGPVLGEIRADLVSAVPGVASLDVVAEGDSFRLEVELSGGERLPARLVSDGTLRILALLTAMHAHPRPCAMGIEEPENGIYPGRLRKLLDLLEVLSSRPAEVDGERSATEQSMGLPMQLLMTTHSPVVLAVFRSRPECLRYIHLVRRDGHLVTRARRVGVSVGDERRMSLREVDELLQAASSEVGE